MAVPKKKASKPKRRNLVTADSIREVTITNTVTLAMLIALAQQQRKTPEKYLEDLLEYHYHYI